MPRVKYRDSDIDLVARMMRAEAEGEGQQGMLYVGNVIVNRVIADCPDFADLRTDLRDVPFKIIRDKPNVALNVFQHFVAPVPRLFVCLAGRNRRYQRRSVELIYGKILEEPLPDGFILHDCV